MEPLSWDLTLFLPGLALADSPMLAQPDDVVHQVGDGQTSSHHKSCLQGHWHSSPAPSGDESCGVTGGRRDEWVRERERRGRVTEEIGETKCV
jgi:hypothetical protein